MKKFYLRWSGILFLGILITLTAWQRYVKEVSVMTPDQLREETLSPPVRMKGRIEPGSLKLDMEHHQAHFEISWNQKRIPVNYAGEDLDNLREFKIIVLIGTWDALSRHFESQKMALTPNYGFITAAYLAGLIPLSFFLFKMERKVVLLYDIIKQEKIYQPEESV